MEQIHPNSPTRGPSSQCRLSVAVIGAGWAARARHLPALRANPYCRVLGVVDRQADRARALAAKFKLPFYGTSCDEPWLADVDAVTIAVPPRAHHERAREMLGRGKHVLLEKLFVGRFVEKKGLHIIKALAAQFADVDWVLAGAGPIGPTTWRLANVRTIGMIAHNSMASLYQAADL